MSVSLKQLVVEFSTADAERPTLHYDAGTLTVRFADWQEQLVRGSVHGGRGILVAG